VRLKKTATDENDHYILIKPGMCTVVIFHIFARHYNLRNMTGLEGETLHR
jgi:hypothetical protein